jgi:Iron-containing alcohol dehydrogenase
MEVRWGLAALPALLDELPIERPFLVASERWQPDNLAVEVTGAWREVPSDRIADAIVAAQEGNALLAVGGGSAIDLAKAISAETKLPVVSVPTTYSGSEWTTYFGVRDPDRRMRGGGGGANLAAIVYEPALTLGLPRAETVGTRSTRWPTPRRRSTSTAGTQRPSGRRSPVRLSSRERCRVWPTTVTTSRRGRDCSRARCTRAPLSARRAWGWATRWRRRSAAGTGCRTVP